MATKPFKGKPSTKSSAKPTARPAAKPSRFKPKDKLGAKSPSSGKKSPGPKGFKKKKRFEEVLDLKFTDKELGELDRIKRKLAEMREYKRILAEDGQKPDVEDKARESELIVRLLRIEKNAKMAARQKAKAEKTERFREAEAQAEFAKQKKKARQERFEDE
jgi:hypothetical protein